MAHHGHGTGVVAPAPSIGYATASPPPPAPRRAFGTMTNIDMHGSHGNNGVASTLPTSPASSISPPMTSARATTGNAPPSSSSPVAGSPVGTARAHATTTSGGVTPHGHNNNNNNNNNNNGNNGHVDDRYRSTITGGNTKSSATPNGGRHISSDNVMDITGASTMAAQTLAEMTAAVRQTSMVSPAAHDLTAIHTISFHAMNEPSPESQATKAALYRTVRTSIFTLQFADPRIELEFKEHYRARYLPSLVNSLKIGTLIWAGFIGYDIGRYFDGKTSYFTETIITRIIALLCGIIAIFVVGRLKLLSHVERMMALLMTVVGTAQILFGIWDEGNTLDPTYSMFLIVVSSICPTLLRQRFVVSFWCNIGLLLFFIVLSAGTQSFNSQNDFLLQVCGLLVSNGIFSYYAYNREQHLRDGFLTENRLRIEEQMCNSLLEKMLPQTVIAQLRVGVDFVYEKHSNVTVLFSHIDDFDNIAASLTAHEVVALLNTIFSAFDTLTDQWSVYKIETIGDVYLVASNCPTEFKRKDHASAICGLALDMAQDATRPRLQQLARQPVRLKLGINSGAVIAGVVGMRCPRYRLMGDTMNVGSRMSTTCEPGEIQLSQTAYTQVQGEFIIESRGEIPIKGKGMMTTYLLKGHRHSNKTRHSPEPGTLLPFTVPESTTNMEGSSGTKTSSYARTNSTGQRVIENGSVITTAGKNVRNANRLSLDRTVTGTSRMNGSPLIVPASSTTAVVHDASLLPPSSPPNPIAGTTSSATIISPPRLHPASSSEPAAILASMLPHATSSAIIGPGLPGSPGTRHHGTHDFTNKTRASFATHGTSANAAAVDDSGSDMDDEHDELSYSAPASFDPSARRHSDSKETAAVNLIIRQKANRIKGDSVNKRNRWQARTSGGQGALSRITSTASMVAASLNGGESSTSRPQSALPIVAERPAGPVPPTPSASHGGGGGTLSAAPSARGISHQLSSAPGSPQPGSGNNEVKMANIPRGSLSPRPGGSTRWPTSSPTLQAASSTAAIGAMIGVNGGVTTNISSVLSSIPLMPLSPPHTTTAVHTIAALTPGEAAEAAARAEADMAAIAAAVANQNPVVPIGSTLTISAHPQAFGYNRMFECPPAEVVLQTPKPWYMAWSLLFEEYPELEWRFQLDYQPRFAIPNRGGIVLLTCAFALLAVYDTLVGLDAPLATRLAAWIIRGVALIVGIILYIMTRHRIYHDYMQLASTMALTFMGLCFITITALLDTYSEAYGVGCVLILLAIMSMQIGLQWRYSIWSTIVLLAYYIIAGEIWRAVPTVVVMLFIGGLLYSQASHASEYFVREDFVRRIKLKNEHTRSAAFLQHMLPATVIDELSRMAGQMDQYVAHERPNCSVFFCDIVSFTTLASSIPPEDVVAILNVIFATFDALTSHFDVYKVETIGDAYLCCSGVVGEMEGHSQRLLECALGFQESIQYFRTPNDKELKLRIGIHTGPLLAGVVGMKMPRYHLFGETVTIAEEMEQKGIPGAVAICEDTFAAVQGINSGQPDDLDFVPVAPLILKNGRSLKRYMVQLPNVVEAHVLGSAASNAAATTSGPMPPSPRGPLASHISNAGLTSLPGSALLAAVAAAAAANTSANGGTPTEPLTTRGTTPNGTVANGSSMASPLAAFLLAADVVNLTAGHHRAKTGSISITAPSPDVSIAPSSVPTITPATATTIAGVASLTGHHMPRFLQRRPSTTQILALQTLHTLGSPITAEAQATLGSAHGAPRRLAPLGGHTRNGTSTTGNGNGNNNNDDDTSSPSRDRARSIAHAGHRPPVASISRGPSTTAINHPHHAPTASLVPTIG